MPFTSATPLVPHFDVTVHIVLDDFGKAGHVYRETAEEDTTLGSVVDDLLTGQFNNPVRVVAFNTSEGNGDLHLAEVRFYSSPSDNSGSGPNEPGAVVGKKATLKSG